jgi:hypothetical protein
MGFGTIAASCRVDHIVELQSFVNLRRGALPPRVWRRPMWFGAPRAALPAALVYKNALPPLCSVDAAPARRDTLLLILSPGPPSRPTRPTRPPSCTRLFATDWAGPGLVGLTSSPPIPPGTDLDRARPRWPAALIRPTPRCDLPRRPAAYTGGLRDRWVPDLAPPRVQIRARVTSLPRVTP